MACLSFSFDDAWEGLAKKVLFVLPDGQKLYKSCRADAVTIPREVMNSRGKSRCFVIGRKGKRRLVSVGFELIVLYTPTTAEEDETCQ